jgi:TPR repeat protein
MRFALILAAALAVASPAWADLRAGVAALESEDYAKAIAELKPLAEADNAEAQYWMGRIYDGGLGVPADPKQALVWFGLAAQAGHADAQRIVGAYHEEGKGGAEKDYAKAFQWYEKSAGQGNDRAMRNLARLYSDGRGVKADPKKAYELLSASAAHGNKDALRNLGYMYYFGVGVRRDPARAAELFRQAGDDAADFDLGRLYYRGEGVEKDLAKAAVLFEQAARDGHPKAQLFLGRMYALGEGVETDNRKAYYWLTLASAQEEEAAAELLRDVRRRLNSADIKQVDAEVKAFQTR